MLFLYSMDESFDVGMDTGTLVNLNYDVPFKFTGTLDKVVINLRSQDAATKAVVEKTGRVSEVQRAVQALD